MKKYMEEKKIKKKSNYEILLLLIFGKEYINKWLDNLKKNIYF